MRFASIIISLVAISVAEGATFRRQEEPAEPADPAQPGEGANVYTDLTFNELSISEGPAGTAAEKATAKLGGLPEDLSTVSDFDLQFLDNVNGICNQAERGSFDTGIEALAETPGEEALALDCGKTANKVLKLTATILKLQIQEAQGDPDFNATKFEEEQKKLARNVEADVINGEAGLECVSAAFEATTADPDATENEKNKARELAAENVAFASRELLGLEDPPANKLARENAAKTVAEQEAAAGGGGEVAARDGPDSRGGGPEKTSGLIGDGTVPNRGAQQK